MEGPSQPGWHDLTLGEFQAKLLAARNGQPDAVEEEAERASRRYLRWVWLVLIVGGVLFFAVNFGAALLGAVATVALAVAIELVLRRRERVRIAELEANQFASGSDQP